MTTAIEGDIKGAFDNVNHKILIKILKLKISILKKHANKEKFVKKKMKLMNILELKN